MALLAATVPAAPLGAQTPDTVLTVADARKLLRQHSPDYRAALAAAAAAGGGVWSAWGDFLPQVTASASFARNAFTTRTFVDPTGVSQRLDDPIESTSKSVSQAIQFQWSAFRGGRRFFELGASRARARSAELAAVARLVELESQVESQYFEALKQQQLARLARDLLAARRRDVEIAEARFRIAAVAQTDVLQAEIQVGRQELAALQAEQAAEAARRELSALVGLAEEIDYALRDTVAAFDPAGIPLDELVGVARRSHPDLARLDADVEARSRSLWAARGTFLPNVSLSLVLSRSEALGPDGTFFTLDPQNTGSDFRLTFSWPLLNGFQKKWETGQESARLQEARQQRRAGVLGIEKEVRNAYDALVTGYRAVELQSRNVELAREAVRLTTERYRVGASSYIELQQATSQATEAERGLIEARYEFMKSFARLQAAVGRPIERP